VLTSAKGGGARIRVTMRLARLAAVFMVVWGGAPTLAIGRMVARGQPGADTAGAMMFVLIGLALMALMFA
jgi:hypothetical protein